MTEYSGAKAPNVPPARFVYDYRIYYCCRLPVDESCEECEISALRAWRREDEPSSPRSVWQMAYAAGQRAQAEKDAEIAESHDVCAGEEPCDCNKIAAAIRIAVPKEGS